MPRDSQKTKFYKTERDVFATRNGHFPIDFETDREVQAFVNRVTKSREWKRFGGRAFVQVVHIKRNNQWARGWGNKIEIPPWARGKAVVLHELTHGLTYDNGLLTEHHSQSFAFLYRQLISQEFGDEKRRLFDLAGERRGLKWNPDSRILKRAS
jgi:hypothetical protein